MACILIVDDVEQVRDTLRHLLESDGHIVVEAADGEAALTRYLAHLPEIAIVDIVMPVKEGIETIMSLRHLDADLLIIAMSGAEPAHYLKAAKALGADVVLKKPFSRDRLLEAMQFEAAPARNRPEQPRILVVDDDPFTGASLRVDLLGAGFIPIGPLADVQHAIEMLGRVNFQVAIVNTRRHGEILYPLLDELTYRGIPFIILNGEDPRNLPRRFRTAARLSTPYHLAELVRVVQSTCGDAD